MAVVGIETVREGESAEGSGGGATVPAVIPYRGYCSQSGGG